MNILNFIAKIENLLPWFEFRKYIELWLQLSAPLEYHFYIVNVGSVNSQQFFLHLIIKNQYYFCLSSQFTGNCAINEVRVNPCPEAKQDRTCKVKRGRSATIEYDYTPGMRNSSIIFRKMFQKLWSTIRLVYFWCDVILG